MESRTRTAAHNSIPSCSISPETNVGFSAAGTPASPPPLQAKIEPNEILAGIYQDSLSGRETLLNGQRWIRAAAILNPH